MSENNSAGTALAPTRPLDAATLEQVVIGGDLATLSAPQRLAYYRSVCESVGLNPLTQPFAYIRLNNKLTLYARKDATDQLRDKHQVNARILSQERTEDVYVVTVEATTPGGRSDTDIGAVSVVGMKGEALANAMMKAVTKAKRRVTLSICGLGWLDETEVETIRDASPVPVDAVTGEIVEADEGPAIGSGGKPAGWKPAYDAPKTTAPEAQPPATEQATFANATQAPLAAEPPSDVDRAAYARGLELAARLGIDTTAYEIDQGVTKAALVQLSKKLKVEIDKAQQAARDQHERE